MPNEFMDKHEANEYYEGKSPFKKVIERLPIRTIMKVFPGRQFILFHKDGEEIRVHSCLRANVIAMDKDGLCILLKESGTGQHIRVGYVPTPVTAGDGRAVFLALPSRCTVERTLRRSPRRKGEIMESTALGMLVKQEESPIAPIMDGALMFLPYDEFKKMTGRRITEMEG